VKLRFVFSGVVWRMHLLVVQVAAGVKLKFSTEYAAFP